MSLEIELFMIDDLVFSVLNVFIDRSCSLFSHSFILHVHESQIVHEKLFLQGKINYNPTHGFVLVLSVHVLGDYRSGD